MLTYQCHKLATAEASLLLLLLLLLFIVLFLLLLYPKHSEQVTHYLATIGLEQQHSPNNTAKHQVKLSSVTS